MLAFSSMNLELHIQDMSARKALAQQLGISPDYLWQVATGWNGRKPSHDLAKRIEGATNGAVSRHDLRPDIFPPEIRVVPVGGSETGAKVDPVDYERVAARHWYAVTRKAGIVYAESAADPQVMMHRFIFGDACRGMVVDHINGDGLDNRRSNLRICTQRENSRNRKAVRGYNGVSWRPDIGKWRARIMVDRKEIGLGTYESAEEAAHAYDAAAIQHFGEFARLNFPPK